MGARKYEILGLPIVILFLTPFLHAQEVGTRREFEQVRAAAEDSDATPFVQRELGARYRDGIGTSQDYIQAFKWIHKAAIQGYSCAQVDLGYMYWNGDGRKRDYSEALMWYRKAAAQAGTQSVVPSIYRDSAQKCVSNANSYLLELAHQAEREAAREDVVVKLDVAAALADDTVADAEKSPDDLRSREERRLHRATLRI